jgi:hypothetical protein
MTTGLRMAPGGVGYLPSDGGWITSIQPPVLGDRDGMVVSFLPRDDISSLLLVGRESKGDSLLVSDGVGVRASWFSVEFGLNLYVLLGFFSR